jgi:hypothetical protein
MTPPADASMLNPVELFLTADSGGQERD